MIAAPEVPESNLRAFQMHEVHKTAMREMPDPLVSELSRSSFEKTVQE